MTVKRTPFLLITAFVLSLLGGQALYIKSLSQKIDTKNLNLFKPSDFQKIEFLSRYLELLFLPNANKASLLNFQTHDLNQQLNPEKKSASSPTNQVQKISINEIFEYSDQSKSAAFFQIELDLTITQESKSVAIPISLRLDYEISPPSKDNPWGILISNSQQVSQRNSKSYSMISSRSTQIMVPCEPKPSKKILDSIKSESIIRSFEDNSHNKINSSIQLIFANITAKNENYEIKCADRKFHLAFSFTSDSLHTLFVKLTDKASLQIPKDSSQLSIEAALKQLNIKLSE